MSELSVCVCVCVCVCCLCDKAKEITSTSSRTRAHESKTHAGSRAEESGDLKWYDRPVRGGCAHMPPPQEVTHTGGGVGGALTLGESGKG